MVRIRFGPAGKPIEYKKQDITGVPEFLHEMGLDAFEYQAVRGVKISEEKARRLGEKARAYDVLLSIHAPYYINFGSVEERVYRASIKRLCNSILAAKWMNAYIVVFHPGYYKGTASPEEAVKRTINALREVSEYRSSIGASTIRLGPETTGKTSQIGTVEEVIEMCRAVDNCAPVVDWAHIHARSQGSLIKAVDEVIAIIETIEKELGANAVKPLHMHFSKIEYGKGGEREHHTLGELDYGPDFEIVCQGITETGIDATIISESPILEKDALLMKGICIRICGAECVAH